MHDAGNDGDKEDGGNTSCCGNDDNDSDTRPCRSLRATSTRTSGLRTAPQQKQQSRVTTPLGKSKTKRKWLAGGGGGGGCTTGAYDDDVMQSGGVRKRVLRAKTPIRSASRGATSDASAKTPRSSSQTPAPLATDSFEQSTVRSSRPDSRKCASPAVLKPIAVRLAGAGSTASFGDAAKAAEPASAAGQCSTPKAMAAQASSAFNRFGAANKTPNLNATDDMDIFFNSPTTKTLQLLQNSSKRRPTSPTPTRPSSQRVLLASDGESADSDTGHPSLLNLPSNSNVPQSAISTKSSLHRRLFVDPSPAFLDPSSQHDVKVSQLVDKLCVSALESPVKRPQQGGTLYGHSRYQQLSAMRWKIGDFYSEDGDDEFGNYDGPTKPNKYSASGGFLKRTPSFVGPTVGCGESSTEAETCDDEEYTATPSMSNATCENECPLPRPLLALVFRVLKENGNLKDIINAMQTCKLLKAVGEEVLWEAPCFTSMSAMLKMHYAIYGSGCAKVERESSGAMQIRTKRNGGIRGMLGISDPSSPRKLLFPDSALANVAESRGNNAGADTKKDAATLKGNRALASLVHSLTFRLFNPSDRKFPLVFDVQAFLADTFPNLTALSLSGAPHWVNPYLLARMSSSTRLRKQLRRIELTSGAMDGLISTGGGMNSAPNSDGVLPVESIVHFWRRFRSLSSIRIVTSLRLDDHVLKAIADSARAGLTELELAGCVRITDVGLAWVLQRCRNLQTLAIDACPGIRGGSFSVSEAFNGRSAGMAVAGATRDGGGCRTPPPLARLEHLRLANMDIGCADLANLLLAPPSPPPANGDNGPPMRLRTLELANLASVTAQFVRSVVSAQPQLRVLRACGCGLCEADIRDDMGSKCHVVIL
ncbi:hypothetical protein HDU83_009447 [Entophlyctis luteolus]|nr:hypothetical protein HDU83_009447 [Entophlyctis luteolus]